MTKQFKCYYTGKDGITTKCRPQNLKFFDVLPNIGNHPVKSPTPLWAEIFSRRINGQTYVQYVLHAQVSNDIAVYIEHIENTMSCQVLQQFATGNVSSSTLRSYCAQTIELLTQYQDLTSYLMDHPKSITPPILAAYQDANHKSYPTLFNLYYHI